MVFGLGKEDFSLSEFSAGIKSGGEEAGYSARPRELGDSCCSHLNRIDEIVKMKELLDEKDSLVCRIASDNRDLQRKLRSDSGWSSTFIQLGTKLNNKCHHPGSEMWG